MVAADDDNAVEIINEKHDLKFLPWEIGIMGCADV